MSSLNTSLETLFSKMDGFVSSKTVVGEAMQLGDITVIPLVDVSFGVGAGASEKSDDNKKGDTCGGGLGAKISPSAVIVIKESGIQLVNVKNDNSVNKLIDMELVNVKNDNSVNKLIDMVPGILDKLSFGKKSKNKLSKEEKEIFEEERISE